MSTSTSSKRKVVLPRYYLTKVKGQAAAFLTIYYAAVRQSDWVALVWN